MQDVQISLLVSRKTRNLSVFVFARSKFRVELWHVPRTYPRKQTIPSQSDGLLSRMWRDVQRGFIWCYWLVGSRVGRPRELVTKDEETLTEIFTLLKACSGEKVLPRCPRHGHIRSVHDVHSVTASEFPRVLQDHFFLCCLFTASPRFGTCTHVKCLSAMDEKEAQEFEEANKKYVEENWIGKRHEQH